jgi:arylamine N-acetyltransferase
MEEREYLDRLGATLTGVPSAAGLRSLHESHLLKIPLENLDILFLDEKFDIVIPEMGTMRSDAPL